MQWNNISGSRIWPPLQSLCNNLRYFDVHVIVYLKRRLLFSSLIVTKYLAQI